MAKIKLIDSIRHQVISIKKWAMSHKKEAIILGLILLVGAFLRLYRISAYMTFLGDEGRDVIVVRRLLVYGDPILIGPGTSIGNMYLGPLYYYMMAPFLFLANYSPVGPAIMIALLGIITIWFIWYVSYKWFGRTAAYAAAILYTIAPTIIIYSRSSWNPNIMPFFALASVFFTWKAWSDKNYKLLIITGISMAAVLQSHYLGLLLVPILGVIWLLTFLQARKEKKLKHLILNTICAAVLFALLMSPLLIFDLRHNWQNTNAIKQFFTARQETVSVKPWNAIPHMYPQLEKIDTRLLAGRNNEVGKWTTLAIFFATIIYVLRSKFRLSHKFYLVVVWLGISLIGLGVYKQEIYDHYYGFLAPAVFLLFGFLVQKLLGERKIIKLLTIVGIGILILANLADNPLRYPPNMQMQRAREIAEFIKEKANGERFNLATIAERSNRDVYQYFLEVEGANVVDTDPSNTKITVTDQLFVVCEKPREKCDPTHDPSAWITNFGWSKILDEWQTTGVAIFRLGHSK